VFYLVYKLSVRNLFRNTIQIRYSSLCPSLIGSSINEPPTIFVFLVFFFTTPWLRWSHQTLATYWLIWFTNSYTNFIIVFSIIFSTTLSKVFQFTHKTHFFLNCGMDSLFIQSMNTRSFSEFIVYMAMKMVFPFNNKFQCHCWQSFFICSSSFSKFIIRFRYIPYTITYIIRS
jgi:hypothetical protein